jgi:hypothetical protein
MQVSAEIKGLKEAMRALQAAFPEDATKRQRIVRSAMGGAARKTLLPLAKRLAKRGHGSGALSESLVVRAKSKRQMRARSRSLAFTSMTIVPDRGNLKALAMYIQHYYTNKGKTPPAWLIASGIRHGHLVEFGSVHNAAKSFLWNASAARSTYYNQFAKLFGKRILSAVKRAKKAKK